MIDFFKKKKKRIKASNLEQIKHLTKRDLKELARSQAGRWRLDNDVLYEVSLKVCNKNAVITSDEDLSLKKFIELCEKTSDAKVVELHLVLLKDLSKKINLVTFQRSELQLNIIRFIKDNEKNLSYQMLVSEISELFGVNKTLAAELVNTATFFKRSSISAS